MKESLERISIVSNVKVFRIRLIDDKKRRYFYNELLLVEEK